jgi:hypothetical protein
MHWDIAPVHSTKDFQESLAKRASRRSNFLLFSYDLNIAVLFQADEGVGGGHHDS